MYYTPTNMKNLKNTFLFVRERLGKDPVYDWYTALGLYTLASLSIIGINIVMFFIFTNENIQKPVTEETPSVVLNPVKIENIVTKIKERTEKSDSISEIIRIDPSL